MSRKSIAYAYTAGETCHLLYPTTLEQDQDEGSQVITHLQPNEQVVVIATGNDASDRRVQVKTKSGKVGWVSAETEQGIKRACIIASNLVP